VTAEECDRLGADRGQVDWVVALEAALYGDDDGEGES
jgi:hypothetical protein